MLSFKLEEEFNNLFSVEEHGYGYVKLKTPFTFPDGTVIDVYLKLNKEKEFWEKVKDADVDLIGEILITKPSPNLSLRSEVFKLITVILGLVIFI